MYRYLLFAIVWAIAASPLAAQDKAKFFEINKDRFIAGATTVHDTAGADDLFMAGETVRSEQPISGSAHLAGRKVISIGAIGGDAFITGMDISLEGKVTGDATLAGYNIKVGDVAGDLRISGANVEVSGPVAGYALVAGDEVKFQSVIGGDVSVAAREVEFADGARIEGKLTIYEEKTGEIEIPESVVPADRVTRSKLAEWTGKAGGLEIFSWRTALASFLKGVLTITILAAIAAAFIPKRLAELRRKILDKPFWNLFIGFLALSVVIGATIILMVTVIGLLVAPAAALVAFLSAFAGYVVGAYAVGVALLLWIGRPEPDSFATRAIASGIGAFVVAVVGLIPFFGWLAVIAVALTGAGAIAIWLFRPGFFTYA